MLKNLIKLKIKINPTSYTFQNSILWPAGVFDQNRGPIPIYLVRTYLFGRFTVF